jgi:uncharacterized membrane-anchored protein
MTGAVERYATKVPAVTLVFWIIKIAATTLGETGGDTVTMTLNWGYLAGSVLFLALLLVLVVFQIAAKTFSPFLYWATIVASTTAGTTMADYADRSLGIGYAGGSSLLFVCLMATLAAWYWSLGSISVATVATPRAEAFYWLAITFSQTLGTALGDWTADDTGLGYGGGALLFAAGPSLLGRVHPDATARRDGRRLSRQAGERRRPGLQPPDRVGDHRRFYYRLPARSAAAGWTASGAFRNGVVTTRRRVTGRPPQSIPKRFGAT